MGVVTCLETFSPFPSPLFLFLVARSLSLIVYSSQLKMNFYNRNTFDIFTNCIHKLSLHFISRLIGIFIRCKLGSFLIFDIIYVIAMTVMMMVLYLLVVVLLIRSIRGLPVIISQLLMGKEVLMVMMDLHQQRKLHTSLNNLIIYLMLRKVGTVMEKHSTVSLEAYR